MSLRLGFEDDLSDKDLRNVRKRDKPNVLPNSGETQYLVLRKKHLIILLQFLVGALVTFGGTAFALLALNPFGTLLGLIHLGIGLTGLLGGILVVRRIDLPRNFLFATNAVTIAYSTISVSIAGMESLLPSSAFHDSIIGTAVAIAMSSVLICFISRR